MAFGISNSTSSVARLAPLETSRRPFSVSGRELLKDFVSQAKAGGLLTKLDGPPDGLGEGSSALHLTPEIADMWQFLYQVNGEIYFHVGAGNGAPGTPELNDWSHIEGGADMLRQRVATAQGTWVESSGPTEEESKNGMYLDLTPSMQDAGQVALFVDGKIFINTWGFGPGGMMDVQSSWTELVR
jgi:hypothetical protein